MNVTMLITIWNATRQRRWYIAVANAIEEAKAAADYICDTNDNDGVAKRLEGNVL